MEKRKQAILVIAHNNVEILKKSIELLDSNYFDFFVHIDKKSNIEYEDIKKICKKSKLFFYKKFDLRWGDYSIVECEMFLLNQAYEENKNYEYFHLISGVDLPIKKNIEIYEFFNNNYGKEFVHFLSKDIPSEKKDWIKYYHYMRLFKNNKQSARFNKIIVKIQKIIGINRIKNNDSVIMTGSEWFSITDTFCKYLISKKEYIKKMFKNTQIPDEFFIQTLLYNSKFKDNLYNKEFDNNYEACARLIVWKEKDHPYIWKLEDYNKIINSNCMFARKFDYNESSQLVDKIYSLLKK